MASNTSYSRNYYAVTYSELGSIPVRAGNVIAISDSDAIYYDIPDNLNDITGLVIRRKASGIMYVTDLPTVGLPDVLYIKYDGEETIKGNLTPVYREYIWDVNKADWIKITDIADNEIVKSVVNDTADKIYFTGSLTDGNVNFSRVEKLTNYL